MPARSSHAPWRLPCNLVRLLARLPESEVERIAFNLFYCDPCTGLEVVNVLSRELAVVFELSCAVIYISVNLVSITLVDKSLYEIDDVINVLGYLRMNIGRNNIKSSCIFEILLYVLLGYLRRCDALLPCSVDDLVIYVSKVLNELYIISAIFEISSERVKHNKRSRISDMEIVINRRSAHIYLYLALLERNELLLLIGKSVVYSHIINLLLL